MSLIDHYPAGPEQLFALRNRMRFSWNVIVKSSCDGTDNRDARRNRALQRSRTPHCHGRHYDSAKRTGAAACRRRHPRCTVRLPHRADGHRAGSDGGDMRALGVLLDDRDDRYCKVSCPERLNAAGLPWRNCVEAVAPVVADYLDLARREQTGRMPSCNTLSQLEALSSRVLRRFGFRRGADRVRSFGSGDHLEPPVRGRCSGDDKRSSGLNRDPACRHVDRSDSPKEGSCDNSLRA